MAELIDSGMRSVEHFGGMLEGCSSREDELLKASLDALSLSPAQRAESTLRNRGFSRSQLGPGFGINRQSA